MLGLQICDVLHTSLTLKYNQLRTREKPGGGTHLALVMMPPARHWLYLQRKLHVLLLRKSCKNSEAQSAGKPHPKWEVHAACWALGTGWPDAVSSQGSQHQKRHKILQLAVVVRAEAAPLSAKRCSSVTFTSSLSPHTLLGEHQGS